MIRLVLDPRYRPWLVGIVALLAVVYVVGLVQRTVGTAGFLLLVGGLAYGRHRWRTRGARPAAVAPAGPREDAVLLGRELPSAQPVWLDDRQVAAHGVILGATGSGKTTTLLAILADHIRRGHPVVAIDLKGSDSFGRQLQAMTRAAGRPFQYWRFDGPMVWNPLKYGSATELKDKLISAERFTEPHYQRAGERYLQRAIQVLKQADPDSPVSLPRVVGVLDPPRLGELLKYVPDEMRNDVGPYISGLTRDQKSAVSGLQSRLGLVVESDVSQWLLPAPGRPELDLRHALCGGNEVVLFSLQASRYGKLAAQIAAMVIQDLAAISSYREVMPNRPLGLIAIDEFSALDADNILALLARSRSARLSTLLSTQEMTDLARLAEGFKDQALGIVGMLAVHRQSVPDSAEFIAKMIGTKTVMKHTWQTGPGSPTIDMLAQMFGFRRPGPRPTGMGTVREVEEFIIHPNIIKNLPTGRAVLMTKTPSADACILDVTPWQAEPRSDGS